MTEWQGGGGGEGRGWENKAVEVQHLCFDSQV
jgi:hypothetical protein